MLTVKQVKEALPMADVSELKDGVRYLVRVHGNVTYAQVVDVKKFCVLAGLNVVVVTDQVELLEIIE